MGESCMGNVNTTPLLFVRAKHINCGVSLHHLPVHWLENKTCFWLSLITTEPFDTKCCWFKSNQLSSRLISFVHCKSTVLAILHSVQLIFYWQFVPWLQSPVDTPPELEVCLRGAGVTVASDYSKRRHVVRLTTPGGTELLLQAESQRAMNAWVDTLSNSSAITVVSAVAIGPHFFLLNFWTKVPRYFL